MTGQEAAPAGGFRRLGVEQIFRGHVVTLNRERFVAPDGTEFEREIVRHPGAVAVVPLTDDGHVVMIRQYRATVGQSLLELPAGLLDVAGEDLAVAAGRELQEETGLVARSMEYLCTPYHSPGFSDETVALFLATGLKDVGHNRHGPEEQYIEIVHMPLHEARAAVLDGRIRNAAAAIGILLAVTP